jgi:hypothetical protein
MPTLELHTEKNPHEMKYQEVTQILDSKHFLQHLVVVGGRWFLVNPGPILSTFTCITLKQIYLQFPVPVINSIFIQPATYQYMNM